MDERFFDDCLHYLLLLEQRLGVGAKYANLEPFGVNPSCAVDIQRAARRIAEFIGLGSLVFVVAAATQRPDVGGRTEVRRDQSHVLIEVDPVVARSPSSLLAALAHEITHKYLHVYGIALPAGPTSQYEDELLTDVAAVFLGLGKLMLNGCESQIGPVNERLHTGITSAATLKLGYLDRSQLALVYRLVSFMRKTPQSDLRAGLSGESLKAVDESTRDTDIELSMTVIEAESREGLVELLRHSARRTQVQLARLEKELSWLEDECIGVTHGFLKDTHKGIARLCLKAEQLHGEEDDDPAMRALKTVMMGRSVVKWTRQMCEDCDRAEQLSVGLAGVHRILQKAYSGFRQGQEQGDSIVITCRNDGSRLRVPIGKPALLVTCPECHYQFVADTRRNWGGEVEIEEGQDSQRVWGITKWISRIRGKLIDVP